MTTAPILTPPPTDSHGLEKREKREKREKATDRSSLLVGGAIPILLGSVLLAAFLDFIQPQRWWAYFFIGLGIILLFQALYRYRTLRYTGSILSLLVSGPVFLFIGAAAIVGVRELWPFIILALILTGVIIIIAALNAKFHAPRPTPTR